ncbi:hypothetical protein PLICRDRAFT_103756 [Plicaturopsis crispa FD-325 SS-3]|nr:hypothetical protein PLICRDRAFT_103756 [Plicaturopsis crispa FD-325 SS-3]
MSSRRAHSTNGPLGDKDTNGHAHAHEHNHEHGAEHAHEHAHDHSHSHSLFSVHTHSHAEGGENAEKLVEALQGRGDRGSQITLVGLSANIVLTAAKGTAGWYMHSASLLAEAGHSMGDLLGDFVTLFCWRLSRRPPTEKYPFGFAKFETLGTTTVSLLLIGGALGIGFHSYHLLVDALSHTAAAMPAGPMQDILQNVTSTAQHVPVLGHAHSHGHGHASDLDPNAAWFAAVSIFAKEWLYRATKKVADAENSPVLLANAIHHRSDAYSSTVVLCAIMGSWYFPALPLDPIGGVLVSILILRQSWGVLVGALGDLTDASVAPSTQRAMAKVLEPLLPHHSSTASISQSQIDNHTEDLLAIRYLRAKRAGSHVTVDLTADVPRSLDIARASMLEEKIAETLRAARKEIRDVRVKFHPVDVPASDDTVPR